MLTETRDPNASRDNTRAALICAVIVLGLAFDQFVPFWGQNLTSVGLWILLLHWVHQAGREEQITLIACVVYATLGECFLSLVWGLYDYRLYNIPAFVPPGHALLLMLGLIIAKRLRDWITWFVPLAATPFVLLLAVIGIDTFGLLLFAILILCMIFSHARKLYAVMFVLSLAMEIYGTWLGNWAWAIDVPWLGLTTTNPPLAAGVFYCVLDFLVMSTVRTWRVRSDSVAIQGT
ncbi:MAG: hypothetical protein ABL891_14000 [Burkholderiales bacterium]